MSEIEMFCTFCEMKADNLLEVNPCGCTQRRFAWGETDPEHKIKSNCRKQAHFHQNFSRVFESSFNGVVPSTVSTLQNLVPHLNATLLVNLKSFCGWQSMAKFQCLSKTWWNIALDQFSTFAHNILFSPDRLTPSGGQSCYLVSGLVWNIFKEFWRLKIWWKIHVCF